MYKLTEEGLEYLKNGLPEKSLLKFLENEKPLKEIVKFPKSEIAIGWAKKNRWIEVEDNIVRITDTGKKILKEKTVVEQALEKISRGKDVEPELITLLLRRSLVFESKEKPEKEQKKESIIEKLFKRGPKKKEVKAETNEIAQLTPGLILSGEWKSRPFKAYDVHAPAPKIIPGKIQPYVV